MSTQPIAETTSAPEQVLIASRVRGEVKGDRPIWLMCPRLLLLIVIIGIPLLIAFYISFLNLDQYSLRKWIAAPWVGLSNYVTALSAGSVVGSSALVSLG